MLVFAIITNTYFIPPTNSVILHYLISCGLEFLFAKNPKLADEVARGLFDSIHQPFFISGF
jgi:hypothetical protein